MERIFNLASQITTPIAFAALGLLVVFLLTRQLLRLGVFSGVGPGRSAAILIKIINRLFLLAFVVCFLVFLVAIIPVVMEYFRGGNGELNEDAAQSRAATDIAFFYAGDAAAFYKALAPPAQKELGYDTTARVLARERYQLPGPPLSRQNVKAVILGANAIVTADVEFDQTSKWRESLGYVAYEGRWHLWNLSVAPTVSFAGPSDYLSASSSPLSLAAAKTMSTHVGKWTPPPGWEMRVQRIGEKSGDFSCDLHVVDTIDSVAITLRAVLGGCTQKVGSTLQFLGQVVESQVPDISFRHVRIYPTQGVVTVN